MRHHLHHGAVEAHGGALEAPGIGVDLERRERAERDEAHVRNRRVRHELLHVLLHERNEADVHHSDQRQRDDQPVEFTARVRGDGQAEAQEAVTAHLQHDGGQDHGSARGRLDVGVRQPGVHRPHRHLHGERQQERREDQHLLAQAEWHGLQVGDGVAAALQVQVDQRHQHQHRAEEGVEEELQCRVHAPRAAPHADDHEHRDEHRFPQHVEQHRVEGGEHADHQALEDQERGQVLRGALLDHGPAGDHHQRRDERREHDQRHRDAIHAQVVPGVERTDPRLALDELHGRGRRVETSPEDHARHERDDRRGERQPTCGGRVALADEQQEQASRDRQPDEHAQDGPVSLHGVSSPRVATRAVPRGR